MKQLNEHLEKQLVVVKIEESKPDSHRNWLEIFEVQDFVTPTS